MRSRGAVWPDLEFLVGDLASQTFDSGGVCSACAGQTDVGGIDASASIK
jgi:hypothetical protein